MLLKEGFPEYLPVPGVWGPLPLAYNLVLWWGPPPLSETLLITVDIFPDTASGMVTGFHITVLTGSLQTIARSVFSGVKTGLKTGGLLCANDYSQTRKGVQSFQRPRSAELH